MAEILSEPSDPDGYVTGEKIIVIFDSEEPLSVLDSPRLEIEIGDYVRLAEFRPAPEDGWLPDRPSRTWRFEYEVARDDLDVDGISIPEPGTETVMILGSFDAGEKDKFRQQRERRFDLTGRRFTAAGLFDPADSEDAAD